MCLLLIIINFSLVLGAHAWFSFIAIYMAIYIILDLDLKLRAQRIIHMESKHQIS
jgi:hypothetical protein